MAEIRGHGPEQDVKTNPTENKPGNSPQKKDSHPSEANLKLFEEEQTVNPDGSVVRKTKKEYYNPNSESNGSGKSEQPKDSGSEKAPESPKSPEAPEKKAEKPVTGNDVVDKLKNDPHTPENVKEHLKDPHKAEAVASAVEEKSVFGQRAKNFFKRFGGGFVAGMAARAGIRFFAMRALDMGTVGAGVVAGGVAGGGMEAIKSFRAESKRLYDLKTYSEALSGYDSMTNLDKVTAVIALEKKLKEKFTGRTLKPAEHAELQAQLLNLRTKLEAVTNASTQRKADEEMIKNLLKFRDPDFQSEGPQEESEKKPEKEGKLGKFLRRVKENVQGADFKDKDNLEKLIILAGAVRARNNTDRELLKAENSEEVNKRLKQFYKERGLNRNWKHIGWETTKGAVIGAAGGAAGAYVFEHFVSPHLPWGHHADMGQPTDAGHPAAGLGGVDHGGDLSHVGSGGEVTIHIPGAEDTQHLQKTVWDTCKQYMIHHGVAHPSNHDVNEAMIKICGINEIEIAGHHPGGFIGGPNENWNLWAIEHNSYYQGFHHQHFDKLIDYKLHNGMPLKGFDQLTDLVRNAGGHVSGPQELITHMPGAGAAKEAHDWLIKDAAQHLAEQDKHLHGIWETAGWGTAGVAGTGALVGATLWLRGLGKEKKGAQPEVANTMPTPELVGNSEELKTATLERRLELLNQVKVEALGRLSKGGPLFGR